jgi:hypothetical protein
MPETIVRLAIALLNQTLQVNHLLNPTNFNLSLESDWQPG